MMIDKPAEGSVVEKVFVAVVGPRARIVARRHVQIADDEKLVVAGIAHEPGLLPA
jgi:hypothetical protein